MGGCRVVHLGVGTWFARCQMTTLRMKSSRPPFLVRCAVLPHPPSPWTPLATPWEEVCCTVATLNQHRPNEVSHLTPSSLRPSHGCQSHNEWVSISSAWLTHFDSWESLGPVRSKLPLSKCHHQRIHQPQSAPFVAFSWNEQSSLLTHWRKIPHLNTAYTHSRCLLTGSRLRHACLSVVRGPAFCSEWLSEWTIVHYSPPGVGKPVLWPTDPKHS